MKMALLVFLFFTSLGVYFEAFGQVEPADPDEIYELEQNYPHLDLYKTIEKLNAVSPALKKLKGRLDPGACLDCDIAPAGKYKESFESSTDPTHPRYCADERNYFEKTLAAIKASDPNSPLLEYMNGRPANAKIIPRKCVSYIMDSFLAPGYKEKSDSLATCKSKNGIPIQGSYKACVTEQLVNLTYNVFTDVADCLNFDPKLAMPKLMIESGMNFNTFNSLKVFNQSANYYRNIMELRVCLKPGTDKISSLEDLAPCDQNKKKAYLAKESALIGSLMKADERGRYKLIKALADLRSGTKPGAFAGKRLRDVYDFQSANWLGELEEKLSSKSKYNAQGKLLKIGDCAKYFLESFCDKPISFMGGDAGIGQFTSPAVDEVENFSKYKSAAKPKSEIELMKTSTKPSCQRLVKFPGVIEDLEEPDCQTDDCIPKSSLQRRCAYIAAPPNPALALIKYGLLMKSFRSSVQTEWRKQDISNLKQQAGLTAKDDELHETLTILSYNQGPTTAVSYFKTWLQSRINSKDTALEFEAYLKKNVQSGAKNYLTGIRNNKRILDRQLGKDVCTKKNFLSTQ